MDGQTDRRTDGQTDRRRNDFIDPLCGPKATMWVNDYEVKFSFCKFWSNWVMHDFDLWGHLSLSPLSCRRLQSWNLPNRRTPEMMTIVTLASGQGAKKDRSAGLAMPLVVQVLGVLPFQFWFVQCLWQTYQLLCLSKWIGLHNSFPEEFYNCLNEMKCYFHFKESLYYKYSTVCWAIH